MKKLSNSIDLGDYEYYSPTNDIYPLDGSGEIFAVNINMEREK